MAYNAAMTNTLPDRQIFTISQLNRRARQLLETHLSLLWARGEISNLSRPSSGHWYFTLKDSEAQIRCAMFRNRNGLVGKPPKDGDQVLVRGRVSLYENRGDYQLIVEHLEADGAGLLQQQFEMLKNKLAAEGLFDPDHKIAIPTHPQHIGVITSPTGAAVRDILHVLKRRSPWIRVTLYPSAVQGKDAADELVSAIELANSDQRCDVLLLARGGGSIEDLWSFNEERVARAIHDSALPIVSAVGHETDFTIADFVADQRAPTPSAAAEMVSPDGDQLLAIFRHHETMLLQKTRRQLQHIQQKLEWLRKRLRSPADRLREQSQHLDHLEIRLMRAMAEQLGSRRARYGQLQTRFMGIKPGEQLNLHRLRLTGLEQRMNRAQREILVRQQERLRGLASTLNAVSPLATLERGYAIARDAEQRIVRSIAAVEPSQTLQVLLSDGELNCTINSKSAT